MCSRANARWQPTIKPWGASNSPASRRPPRGLPQIEVTFDIDANGIVHVAATDKATGKEQSIRITASSGLSQEEIDRLVNEAKTHASADRQKRELVDARNQADALIYTTEKSLADLAGKIDASSRDAVQQSINQLKEAVKGEDTARIRQLTEELNRTAQAMAQSAYGQPQGADTHQGPYGAAGQPGDTRKSGSGDDEVVDAEYEEVA